MKLPLLRYGDSSPYVLSLQKALQKQGFFKGHPMGNFRDLTKAAVVYFQQTHLDRHGQPLEVDGIVGDETWWAIAHPSQGFQKSGILKGKKKRDVIPDGITGERLDVLQAALQERLRNVAEVPDGSNWGPLVSRYLAFIGLGPAAWCYAFVMWVYHKATDKVMLDKKHGRVSYGWQLAKERGMAFPKASYTPIPGDLVVLLYRNSKGQFTGLGHIAFVIRVSGDGKTINTIGGNEGNRVKFGVRDVNSTSIVGFINLYGDAKNRPDYSRGLIEASSVATESTR